MKSIFALLLSLLSVLPLYSQQTLHFDGKIKQFEEKKVESRRVYYGNIPEKTTKVVLAGDNSMTDLLYKNAIQKGWYISPFEFCTYQEFDKIKCDTNYYFLLRIESFSKKGDSSMEFITFIKGDQKAVDGIEKMPEVLSLPIFSEKDREGRIFSYLPAYINIFQSYIASVASGEIYPSFYNRVVTKPLKETWNKTIFFREDDFAFPVTQDMLNKKFNGKAHLVTQEEIDDAIDSERPNTLVSLVVAHSEPIKGSYCYTMLISTDTYDLYFYKKHKISKWRKIGFSKMDLRRIAAPFGVSKELK